VSRFFCRCREKEGLEPIHSCNEYVNASLLTQVGKEALTYYDPGEWTSGNGVGFFVGC
jgi:hypothetical protein